MKYIKQYIVCYMLFFSLFAAKAQPTWDFNNTAWTIVVDDGFGGYYNEYFQSVTDTVINSLSYKVITNFPFVIRSDNHKVYGRNTNDTTPDFLLYDFNANVGDIIHNVAVASDPTIFSNGFADFYVMEKDSFSINNKYYNILHVSAISSDSILFGESYWYENIGSMHGLIEQPNFYTSSLTCYTKNDTGIYVYNIYGSNFQFPPIPSNGAAIQVYPGGCNTIGINENKSNSNSTFKIAPNPTNGTFKISITKKDKPIGIKEIKVNDMMGKVVWQTGASANNVFDVDITKYSQGIYYVRSINEDEEIEVQKLVKQ